MIALLLALACGGGFADPAREYGAPVTAEARHPVVINAPRTMGVVDTSRTDVHGTPIGLRCGTCHGPDPAESWAAIPGEPFHTGIELTHGFLGCEHCHAQDRTKLHLADDTLFEINDAIRLCGQCHGPQYRDYQHGAHGGMNGYWDLRQGPRTRNHCVSCHAPHNPAYEKVRPVHPPRDRYLFGSRHGVTPAVDHGDDHATEGGH